MADDGASAAPTRRDRIPTLVALVGGVAFVGLGAWAMAAPRAFFDAAATFPPYNAHLLQDIGAFQIGLGAVLLLATRIRTSLAAALLGVGIGALMHTVSHVIGRDLGGNPQVDIPTFAILTAILLGAGVLALRRP